MPRNPILDDLHETRERLLADAGGTLDGLVARLQEEERRSGREFVRPTGRTRRPGAGTSSALADGKRSSARAPTP